MIKLKYLACALALVFVCNQAQALKVELNLYAGYQYGLLGHAINGEISLCFNEFLGSLDFLICPGITYYFMGGPGISVPLLAGLGYSIVFGKEGGDGRYYNWLEPVLMFGADAVTGFSAAIFEIGLMLHMRDMDLKLSGGDYFEGGGTRIYHIRFSIGFNLMWTRAD